MLRSLRVSPFAAGFAAAVACGSSAALAVEPGAVQRATTQPSISQPAITQGQVDARYKISLNGFDLGNFRFTSNVSPDHYALDTDIELSALLGVFKWRGVTRSTGTIVADKAQPAGFRFDFASSAKSGSVALGFDKGSVATVALEPRTPEPADTVPLKAAHLKGVLDPLSAIMTLTHAQADNPCGRRVAIFDGKQRFDLDLIYSRKVALPGGRNEIGIACRVKYTPIGGYRANDETRALAASSDIEIVFRSVPAAKLMLPQSVSLPTPAGTAELTLERADIKRADNKLARAD